ncbi:MAG: hypothetical protein NC307_06030 [Roseburia sp.]|nr:hypothetical protein [Roseburia sp.]
MGELLFCSRELASIPYYIDTVSLNVYSLEEICYYLKQNIELVEPEFMDQELCEWIRQELKMNSLAERLSRIIQEGQGFLTFVTTLLSGCDYCTKDEILDIRKALQDFENKSEAECAKIRADRFLLKKRYYPCILEYKKLLQRPDIQEEGVVFEGDLWHNLGTAYAGLFFFEEAAKCYEEAYGKNRREESLHQAKAAREMQNSHEPLQKEEPNEMFFQVGIGNLAVADNLLSQWKEEYKRSCR